MTIEKLKELEKEEKELLKRLTEIRKQKAELKQPKQPKQTKTHNTDSFLNMSNAIIKSRQRSNKPTLNKEQIIKKFDNVDAEKIANSCTVKQLREFYTALTGNDHFPKSAKKQKIAEALKRVIRSYYRGKAFLDYESSR